MSTRRIGSFLNLSPIQEISINPFSELNSDNINKITQSISDDKDGAVFGLDVINPNWYEDSLKHFNVFKSGQPYISEAWEFDTDHCDFLLDASSNVTGFKIQDITKCTTQKVTYKINLTDLNLQNLKGKNIEAKFNLSFHIVSGCPKKVFAYVNQNNSCIDYPDNEQDECITLPVIYNFLDDKDTLDITLMFVLDPTDTYTKHTIQETDYNGQSYIIVNNLDYQFDIVNLKDIEYRIKDNDLNGNYPSEYAHPTHILDVTGGIAIKDDAVLNIKGKNRKFIPVIRLDLNNNTSWIRNNPYTLKDFTNNTAEQRGFIYNNIEPFELNKGNVNTQTNELEFKYKDKTFIPSDEYVLTDNDYELNFTLDPVDALITIVEQEIQTNIPECYGSVGYIYSKITNKIIKKIDLVYDKTTQKVDELDVHLIEKDIKIGWNNVTQDTIGVVLSAGPVKVSGHKDEFCPEMVNWAYVVLYYTYLKNPRPNKAYIGLLRDTDLKDLRYREDYVILAKVRFISPNTVDIISYEDRQQIYHSVEKAINVTYGSELTPEELALWIDPAGFEVIPTSASDAITKLIRWIPQWIDKYSRVERSVTDNAYGLFVNNQVIKWVWDDDNERGDLVSSGYYIDNQSSYTPFVLAAWNEELNTILPKYLDGINGQILYYNNESDCDIKFDWLMKNGKIGSTENNIIYVCDIQKDLDRCFDSSIANGCKIVDLLHNKVYVRDNYQWIENAEQPNIVIGSGKLSYNDITKKLFWQKNNEIIEIKLSEKYEGKNGDVFYHKYNTDVDEMLQLILNDDILVCQNKKEVDQCLDYKPDYNILISTWRTFGHYNKAQFGVDDNYLEIYGNDRSGVSTWISDDSSIIQTRNTTDYVGFMTPKSYNDYQITTRSWSTDSGCGAVGVVVAFAKDDNGIEHTLSFCRQPANNADLVIPSQWCLILDFDGIGLDPTVPTNRTRLLYDGSDSITDYRSDWNNLGEGVIIDAQKIGNRITAKTSAFKQNATHSDMVVLNESLIDIDIDTLIENNPDVANILRLFKNKTRFGFSTKDQLNIHTSIKNIKVVNVPIYDVYDNQMYIFDGSNWILQNSDKPSNHYNYGRLTYNELTDKLFWVNENGEYVQILTSLNNLLEKIQKIIDDGISEIEEKTTQAIETINEKINSIISLPDYSNSLSITENREYTVSAEKFPRGAWINFQFNNFKGPDTTNKTIHIRGVKENVGTWHLVAFERGNRTNLDHSPIGNCGVIPIGVGDTLKLQNLVFNGTSDNGPDVITLYGMI